MKKYNYNIRCKICKQGFNPKNKETVFRKMCITCLEIRKEWLEKVGYNKPNPAS